MPVYIEVNHIILITDMDSPNASNASSDSTLVWSPKTPPTEAPDVDPDANSMPTLLRAATLRPIDNTDVEMPTLSLATQHTPMDLDSSTNIPTTTTSQPDQTLQNVKIPTNSTHSMKTLTNSTHTDSLRNEDALRKEARAVLQKVDATLSEQCNRLGNLLDSFSSSLVPPPPLNNNVSTMPVCNNVPTPPLPECNHPFTLYKIELYNCSTCNATRLKRKLWLQNLLQLRDSFGKGILFYNGKVDWQLTIESTDDCEPNSEEVSENPEILVSPESPQPIKPETEIDAPNLAKVIEASEITGSKCELTDKAANQLSETTDLRSNQTNQDTENFKNNSGDDSTKQLSDTTDSHESKVTESQNTDTDCLQSNYKKDIRIFMHKVSLPSTSKRKPAADFFASDSDSSVDNTDLDNSFSLEKEKPKEIMDQVGKGIKRIKLEGPNKPEQRCSVPLSKDDESDVNYKLLMLKMEEGSDGNQNNISMRKRVACGDVDRNLKRHTIFEHLTDVWWGVIGDATCWKCQAYHTLPDIRFCDGFYVPQRDLRSLVMRQREFFAYIKDDLECTTDADLIGLVTREDLCSSSISPFTATEVNFMRDVDRANGLSTNHLYSALYPMRLTELLHWRTLGEIFNFCNLRGCISSHSSSMKPLRFIDCYCNTVDLYKRHRHQNFLASLPALRTSSTATYLYKIITDITDPEILFSPWSNLLLSDPDIKVSLGLHPCLSTKCPSIYLKEIEHLTNSSIVAIGGVGLDARLKNNMDIQVSVFTSFLKIANRNHKTLRMACTGAHATCMELMKTHLHKEHMIHYLNFGGSMQEAQDFFNHFPNGYLGISKASCVANIYSRSLVKMTSLERLLPGSNAPYSNQGPFASLPTEVGDIIHLVAEIKSVSVQKVAQQFRFNTSLLYGVKGLLNTRNKTTYFGF